MKLDFQQGWNTITVLLALYKLHSHVNTKRKTLMSAADKDIIEVVDLILDGIGIVLDAEKDNKIDIADLPLLMKLVPDLGPAFENLSSVPAELAALSQEDASALVLHVVEKLTITNEHARNVVEASLKAAVAVYALVGALRAPKA